MARIPVGGNFVALRDTPTFDCAKNTDYFKLFNFNI